MPDDEENLLKLLDGDDFISEAERRQRQAEQRRLERKRRLEQLQQSESPLPSEKPTSLNLVIRNEEPESFRFERQEYSVDGLGTRNRTKQEDESDDDDFDMFSSSVSPIVTNHATTKTATTTGENGGTQQDWDDSEGYYKALIGEIISLDTSKQQQHQEQLTDAETANKQGGISLRVSGVIGKGVFSSVLKCSTISNSTSTMLPPVVAVKCIRHNETMAKTAFSEILFLQRLKDSPGIVPLLLPTSTTPLEHKGHVLLVFPCADYNLRDVLQKFGKGVGLSLEAVRSYFGQLLAAATHLKKHNIIHSDLKPDNILVSRDFSIVQLGDFGSAQDVSSSNQTQQPTPYLVSRFYRAPEIILGLIPTFAIDLWSLAVSVAEIFLGEVLFKGKTNNDMIYTFMQILGPFSNRLIRQHLVQCQKMPIPPHFMQRKDGAGSDYLFTQHSVDSVTGKPVNKYLSLFSSAPGGSGKADGSSSRQHEVFPSMPLSKKLLKAKSAKDSRTLVLRFSELLQKCLTLDPSRRISLRDALQHDFFTKANTATNAPSTASSDVKAAKTK